MSRNINLNPRPKTRAVSQSAYHQFLTLLDDADNQLSRGEPDMAHATIVEMRGLVRRSNELNDEAHEYNKAYDVAYKRLWTQE